MSGDGLREAPCRNPYCEQAGIDEHWHRPAVERLARHSEPQPTLRPRVHQRGRRHQASTQTPGDTMRSDARKRAADHTPGSGERLTEAERTTVEEALRMWEAKGPTSLTVALLADALYGVRDGLRAADATWALREPSLWESPDARSVPTLLAAIGQVLARHAAEPGAQEAG